MNRATIAVSALLVLAACSTGATTTDVDSLPPQPDAPAQPVTRSPASSPDATVSIETTTTPGRLTPPPCIAPPGDEIATSSGRRIVLRTNGIVSSAPTVLVLHGFTGTPNGIERVANLTAASNAAGVVVAYPQGSPATPGGFAWNSGASVFASSDIDDGSGLVDMIDAMIATGCVERSRLVIAGESNGAGMTLAALCDKRFDGVFRSAVMVVPAVDDGVLAPCADFIDQAVSITAIAGLLDKTTPFDGGNGLLAQPQWFDQVAKARGCTDVDDAIRLTELTERFVATGCGSCTDLITVADGPHTWPGSPETNGDLVSGSFDLNRRIIAEVLAPAAGCLADR